MHSPDQYTNGIPFASFRRRPGKVSPFFAVRQQPRRVDRCLAIFYCHLPLTLGEFGLRETIYPTYVVPIIDMKNYRDDLFP